MPYATYELDGRRRVGRVDGDRLIPLDGLRELGRDTPCAVLTSATELTAQAVRIADVHLRPVIPKIDRVQTEM